MIKSSSITVTLFSRFGSDIELSFTHLDRDKWALKCFDAYAFLSELEIDIDIVDRPMVLLGILNIDHSFKFELHDTFGSITKSAIHIVDVQVIERLSKLV